ncbi:protein lethal(2)denticleless [Fopius arisanus]|uniref:L(2)dtl protein n=1 Tax=Fopius arisanus TaxID=64838 RepID=A0A0C9R671_9HYME|nr:PREDICTED: protein lethal(2)denticleless [Fopius arisanus]
MNIVKSLVRRNVGFESIRDYDLALFRLKCHQDDIYRGITPNTDAPDFNPEPPVFACRFCPNPGYEQILALANEDGKIALQDILVKGEANQALDGTQAHCNAIFDIAWMPNELKLVTASGDQTARLWDVSTQDITQIDCFSAHSRSVKTVVFRPQDKAVFGTGARDGAIMVWDIRASHNGQRRPDNCIMNGHVSGIKSRHRGNEESSRTQSITGLTFQDDMTLISGAAGDGLIKVWDLRKNYSVHKKEPQPKHIMQYTGGSTRNGFTSLLVDPGGITLYASCMDNNIYAYNISSYNPRPCSEFYGHENSTFYVKICLSPDGKYLASGSSDEQAYIWKTSKPGGPLVKLSGHTKEVTCVAWCNVGDLKIVTCSDDSCHRIWRVGLEHKSDNDDMEIIGRAEKVDVNSTRQSVLETTPTVSRRCVRQEHTPSDGTPGPDTDQRIRNLSSGKRTRTQMLAGGSWTDPKLKTVLSPIEENLEPSTKRVNLENRSARRLFSPSSSRATEAGPSFDTTLFSPTLNLPNFVIDGTAPHLVQMSPQKCKENVDWLTKIRKERFEQRSKPEDKVQSPVAQLTPARRSTRSKSAEPRRVKGPSVSLLNFFRLGRECDKDVCGEGSGVRSQRRDSVD